MALWFRLQRCIFRLQVTFLKLYIFIMRIVQQEFCHFRDQARLLMALALQTSSWVPIILQKNLWLCLNFIRVQEPPL
jgi:hypothetical protein